MAVLLTCMHYFSLFAMVYAPLTTKYVFTTIGRQVLVNNILSQVQVASYVSVYSLMAPIP